MEYELSWLMVLLLVGTGIIAGFVNILAAGGSFLTIPTLMLFGIPADIANATNRVGVFLQAAEGIRGFGQRGMLEWHSFVAMMVPTLIGSLAGALLASYLDVAILEPVILTTLIAMAVLMVVKPSSFNPPQGSTPLSPWSSPSGFFGLLLSGIYGGFIQAGVGFVLIAALCGSLRYDLVRANALKMAATGVFTLVSLTVFILRGQILWIPGLLLALGSVVGAWLAVKFAVTVSQQVLRWFLLCVVVTVCITVWLQ